MQSQATLGAYCSYACDYIFFSNMPDTAKLIKIGQMGKADYVPTYLIDYL